MERLAPTSKKGIDPQCVASKLHTAVPDRRYFSWRTVYAVWAGIDFDFRLSGSPLLIFAAVFAFGRFADCLDVSAVQSVEPKGHDFSF